MSGEAERCPRCDREGCRIGRIVAASAARPQLPVLVDQVGLRAAEADCIAHAIDWRQRCVAAEAVADAAEAWVNGDWATARHKRADLVRAIDTYRLARGKAGT